MIYSGIKMPMRDSVEVELRSRQRETRVYPRVSSTRIEERRAAPRCGCHVVRRDRVISEKVRRTRANRPAIYLDRSHAQPSVNAPKGRRGRAKERRAKTRTETRTSKHVLRWCIRHIKLEHLILLSVAHMPGLPPIK